MKIAIVYFSRTHTTENVAKRIASDLGGELFRINSEIYPPSTRGYLRALVHSFRHSKPPITTTDLNLEKYDLVIVGTPVWASNMSAPVRTFLSHYGSKIKRLAYFVTCGGSGYDRVLKQLALLGKQVPAATLSVTSADFLKGSFDHNSDAFVSKLKLLEIPAKEKPKVVAASRQVNLYPDQGKIAPSPR